MDCVTICAIGSGLFALLHAVASITFRADQVVSGVAINFLSLGLTVFAIKKIFDKGQTDFIQYRIEKIDIPGLSDIPVLGKIFFSNVPITSYIAIILAFVVWYVIYKTPFGLRLRAVGEHPMARIRWGLTYIKCAILESVFQECLLELVERFLQCQFLITSQGQLLQDKVS